MEQELGKIATMSFLLYIISLGFGLICISFGAIWRKLYPDSEWPRRFVFATGALSIIGMMPTIGALVAIIVVILFF